MTRAIPCTPIGLPSRTIRRLFAVDGTANCFCLSIRLRQRLDRQSTFNLHSFLQCRARQRHRRYRRLGRNEHRERIVHVHTRHDRVGKPAADSPQIRLRNRLFVDAHGDYCSRPGSHVLEATQRTKATREPGPRTLSGSYSSWLYRDTSPFSIRVAGSRRSELDPVACVQMRLATGDMDYPLCELVAETPADQPARSPLSRCGIGPRLEHEFRYLEVCCVT
jgi:hypothetical protein